MPLEYQVRRQKHNTAQLYGLLDCGTLTAELLIESHG
jgi:hypothetical protein